MVQTVQENKSFFKYCQTSQAKRASELLHTLGCLSIAALKRVVKMNSIKNCHVTTEDIDLANCLSNPSSSFE